ncbi:diacylglycerol/lipid kinase family protein [Ornithinimicrobium sediminis]|uniref:diacylglycerol/lipid kinase family protein n=1 Tax=Ornithinimicrobium sediminis TaxID=2904603 RepID=UPI001E2C5B23|nr:NAD(+)/NADH kinase [Ornithinimicrobium sediminis]
MTRVAVVTNPVRDPRRRALRRVRAVCREHGWDEPLAWSTTPAEPGRAQTRQALAAGADVVVAVGGDGTVREAAEALADTGVPLAVVPLGTANLLARNLRIPLRSVDAAVSAALTGADRPLDLVAVRLTRAGAGEVSTTSLVVAGLGQDGATVAAVCPGLKRTVGWPAYLVPGLWRLGEPLVPVQVSLDGGPLRAHDVWSVLVGSCARIPLGIQVLPGARPDDGRLDVALLAPRHVGQWAPVVLKAVLGLRRDVPGHTSRTAVRVRVTSAVPLTAQVDGDPFAGVTALDAVVRPAALVVRTLR